ncbi:hypothetical protein GGI17_002727 [Coemansia sp. S146]|nr:hypothetical protein GGI17_002727 [Coemansia sp. S146]
MTDLRTVVGELMDSIAADLEAHLSMTARGKGHAYNTRSKLPASDPRGKGFANGPLDAWATSILRWTEKQLYTHLAADYVAPFFEAFVLFVAHHIKIHFRSHGANYIDPTDFVSIECGMFPLRNSVESQTAPARHLIVADAEIVGYPDDYKEAKPRLATKTKVLYFKQHNRRFSWGLTVSNRAIHAYVFGTDGIWASAAMDISSAKGHRALISLLVGWSLCSVDRLGFDPSIRHVVGGSIGGPYLKIDIHEMDERTGKVKPWAYYSQQCVGAADRLFGCHTRYFAASTSPESMDKPAFLIKDMWTTSGSGSADDTHESSFLNVLHAEFDKSSEFGGSFSRLVSSGPVYIGRDNTLVTDPTTTAFARLPSTTQGATKGSGDIKGSSSRCIRQHRHTVTK